MFDEKNTKWLRYYKRAIVISFWSLLVGGVLLGIFDFTAVIDIFIEDSIGELFLWSIGCGIAAFAQLTCGMLILQLLNNIQIIRQRIEKLPIPEAPKKSTNTKTSTLKEKDSTSQPHPAYTDPVVEDWTCSCGKNYPPYVSSCVCGKTKADAKREKAQNN